MSRINLGSCNATEKRILDYLEANASDVLAERINAGKKTLSGAMQYAKSEARKLPNQGVCVCVDDATVFGWIIHFFEEDDIAEKKQKPAIIAPGGAPVAPALKTKAKPETPPAAPKSMLDELLGG